MKKRATVKKRTPIVAVDIFCGVGGLSHGLQRGGIPVVLGIDVDEACRFPFEQNNHAAFLCQDVSSVDSAVIAAALQTAKYGLLAGCAPCQPFSTYSRGERGGARADDWKLVREFARIVDEVQPDFVTMENVPPLADQVVFEELLHSLSAYDVEWDVVQCANLGIPQTRKRLVLIASRHGRVPIPRNNFETRTVKDTISGLRPIEAGDQDPIDPLHVSSRLSEKNLQRIRSSIPGGTWRDWPEALRASCHKRVSGETYPSVYGRMSWDSPSPTITTQCFGFGNGRFGHPDQDRAISLREAAMLQTFPEEYQFLPPGARPSFSVLGRMIGNAVPVRLGEEIAKQINNRINELSCY